MLSATDQIALGLCVVADVAQNAASRKRVPHTGRHAEHVL
jgi:hypothetical protein